MPITKTITLYEYHELPTEKAKEAARNWWIEGDYDWYESVYEDAEQAGIKIKSFDIEREQDIEIEFIDGAFNTAVTIRADHGETCDTYKAMLAYETAMDALPDKDNRNADAIDAIEAEFLKALGQCYLRSLREQLDYSHSEEAIAETLNSNAYTFTETGKRED